MRVLPFLLVVIVLGLPTLAIAQPQEAGAPSPNEDTGEPAEATPMQELEALRELLVRAQYEALRDPLGSLLARDNLTAAEHVAALELRAMLAIAERDERAQARTLTQLFRRDPGHRLSDPNASPIVRAAFDQVRARQLEPTPVAIVHEPPAPRDRSPAQIRVAFSQGGNAVHEVRLSYLLPGDTGYTRVIMPLGPDGASARVPLLADPQAFTVSYFIEAVSPSGSTLARLGTREEPNTFTVPILITTVAPDPLVLNEGEPLGTTPEESQEVESPPKRWWIGVIIAALVVGGGAAVGVTLATRPDDVTGTLGSGTLQ